MEAVAAELGRSPLAKRLALTSAWSVAGELLARGSILFAMLLVARILGKTAYGELGIIRSTVNLFSVFGDIGLGLTANRFVAQYRDHDKPYAGQVIGSSYVVATCTGLAAGLVVIGISGQLSNELLRAPQLAGGLRIAGVLLCLSAVKGAQIGILQGLEAYRLLAIRGLYLGLLTVVCFVAGSSLFGVNGAMAAFLLEACGSVLVLHVLIAREARRQQIVVTYTKLAGILPILRRFSIPVALTAMAVAPFKWLADTVLARNGGFQEVGIFQAAMTISMMAVALLSTLNAPLITLRASSNPADDKTRLAYISLYGPWYAFLLPGVLLLLFPELPGLALGASYPGSTLYPVIVLLVLYCGLMLYYQGIVRLVVQSGSMWLVFLTNVVEGITLFSVFYVLTDRHVQALALAYVASYVLRIGASIPLLLRKHLVPRQLLFDKFFVASFFLFTGIAWIQYQRLR